MRPKRALAIVSGCIVALALAAPACGSSGGAGGDGGLHESGGGGTAGGGGGAGKGGGAGSGGSTASGGADGTGGSAGAGGAAGSGGSAGTGGSTGGGGATGSGGTAGMGPDGGDDTGAGDAGMDVIPPIDVIVTPDGPSPDGATCSGFSPYGISSITICKSGTQYTCGVDSYQVECDCPTAKCSCEKNGLPFGPKAAYGGCPSCTTMPFATVAAICGIPY